MRINLNPRFNLGESYSSLRDDLYKLIASSRTGLVQLQFKNGAAVVAVISGFVTKLESPHFEKNPEVTMTLRCDEPMLKAPTLTNVDVTALDPAATDIVDNLSTAPHGFFFEVSFVGPQASLSISDPNDPDWEFEIIPVGGFLAGDVLHFSSELNNKYLYIVRGVDTIHLADVITSGSVWPILFPKENTLALSGAANLDWVSISYYPTYWGV